jgi:hypothetical protein
VELVIDYVVVNEPGPAFHYLTTTDTPHSPIYTPGLTKKSFIAINPLKVNRHSNHTEISPWKPGPIGAIFD